MKFAGTKSWLIGLAVIPLLVAGCNGSHGESGALLDAGEPFPSFELQSADGSKVSSKDMQSKPYVVAVFATWCPPCKTELSALEKSVWLPMKDKNAAVLGINFGEESAEEISEFAKANSITFPLLEDESGSVRKQLGVESIPVSFVIGADGRIVSRHVGFSEDSIQDIGKELLSNVPTGADQ